MARITVEDCLEKEKNRFALVVLASKRTKEILSGATPLVDDSENKEVVTSLREIAEGKVRFLSKEEAARSAVAGLMSGAVAASGEPATKDEGSSKGVTGSAIPASSQLDELEKLFEDPS